MTLKQFQCWSDWQWPFLILSRKISDHFLHFFLFLAISSVMSENEEKASPLHSVDSETVPTLVWLTVALSHPFKKNHQALLLSMSLSSWQPIVGCLKMKKRKDHSTANQVWWCIKMLLLFAWDDSQVGDGEVGGAPIQLIIAHWPLLAASSFRSFWSSSSVTVMISRQ